jgi:hypothetical protein
MRTLFVAITLTAAAAWTYWIGWPRWLLYLERRDFERAASQLKIGCDFRTTQRLGGHEAAHFGYSIDAEGKPIGFAVYQLPNTVYLIYCTRAGPRPFECQSIEVLRAPAPPPKYQPQSEESRRAAARLSAADPTRAATAYWHDLLTILLGDRRDDFGIRFDIIYEDPSER